MSPVSLMLYTNVHVPISEEWVHEVDPNKITGSVGARVYFY